MDAFGTSNESGAYHVHIGHTTWVCPARINGELVSDTYVTLAWQPIEHVHASYTTIYQDRIVGICLGGCLEPKG